MAMTSDELKRQANDLWKQAVDQLEEVKRAVLKQRSRFESDLDRLVRERDKLLQQVATRTQKLANQGTIHVPKFVRDTADNLNEVIGRITQGHRPAKARAGGKKKVTRRRVKKASA